MEDINQPIDFGVGATPSDQRLRFTDAVRTDLLETTKWAMFFAVLLFLILGLIGIAALTFTVGSGGFVVGLTVMLFYGAILFFPAWYYYKFATLTRRALEMNDNEALDEGFAYLRRFYQFVGIAAIVLIALYLLILVFSVATASRAIGNF